MPRDRDMQDKIESLQQRIIDFRNKPDWKQFHNPKDITLSFVPEPSICVASISIGISYLAKKAAHLLYFVTKNHSFVDGNKRIAALLLACFLQRNGILLRKDGGKRINDNALVALTLMIAESRPEEKDVMARVIVNLINRRN